MTVASKIIVVELIASMADAARLTTGGLHGDR
jgi:hypothetical protein